MKIMVFFKNKLAISALAMSFTVLAESLPERQSLTIYTEQFAPYNFAADGEIKGINIELVAQTCRVAGIECRFELLPWKRAMHNTKTQRDAGLISVSLTPEREDTFQWVGPFVSSLTCFYKLKSRTDITIDSKSSLLNYTVGVARSDIYERVLQHWGFEEGKNFLTYSKKYDDIKMFLKGKHDLIIGSSITMTTQLAPHGLTMQDVEPVHELRDPLIMGNYLALNKNLSTALVTRLQNALDVLKQQGAVPEIIRNYVPITGDTRFKNKSTESKCLNQFIYY